MPNPGTDGNDQDPTGGKPEDPSAGQQGGTPQAQPNNHDEGQEPQGQEPAQSSQEPQGQEPDDVRKWRELSRKHEKQENKYRSELDKLTASVNKLRRDNAILNVKTQYPTLTDEDLKACDADTAEGVQEWAKKMSEFLERHNGEQQAGQQSDPLTGRLKSKDMRHPQAQSVDDFKKQIAQENASQAEAAKGRFHF